MIHFPFEKKSQTRYLMKEITTKGGFLRGVIQTDVIVGGMGGEVYVG